VGPTLHQKYTTDEAVTAVEPTADNQYDVEVRDPKKGAIRWRLT
jgi:hypothetical protein